MPRTAQERILLIGDHDRQVHAALVQAMPGAHVSSVPNYFDGVAELVANPYTAVLAAAEPIERRPEAAVKTLRQLAGDGRVVLFGHPTLEPLSRKMLEFGVDDYVVSPTTPGELQQIFGAPAMRMSSSITGSDEPDAGAEPLVTAPPSSVSRLMALPLADIFLGALLKSTSDAPGTAIRELNAQVAPTMSLNYQATIGAPPPVAPEGLAVVAHPVRADREERGVLYLTLPHLEETTAARHVLSQLAHLLGRVVALQQRHKDLQKLAMTDELTNLYNGRAFRQLLTRIVEWARKKRVPVTLLLFDIDDFKQYNDRYGHGVGDEILKQTANLMKRSCRDHDVVARISGDEFAVVFWDKEGPRQPRDAGATPAPVSASRVPQTPLQILERFRRMLATENFSGLGPGGKGVLTISGGLAVYPYDAQDVAGLIEAADRELMFRAKQQGKNSIFLVGNAEPAARPADQAP